MKRILVWGTGNFIETYAAEIKTVFDKKDYELIAFVDNNPEKIGTSIMGKNVICPTNVKDLQFDEIVIATAKFSYNVIKKQILDELCISEESIHSFTWIITRANDNSERVYPTKDEPKVFDCFPFYNELDILQFRLELLDPYVDYFVLSEIPRTHRWEEKPLYFKENRDKFKKYLDKILYVCTEDLPPKPKDMYMNWQLENYQRNCITIPLKKKAGSNDIVMVSDVDEIPNPLKLQEIKDNARMIEEDVYSFQQDFFYYYFDFCHTVKWNGTYITKYKNLGTPQTWRNICGLLPEIADGGWHMSYFGGVERIRQKTRSTVDSEDDKLTSDVINQRIRDGKDIFGRKGREFEIVRKDPRDIGIRNIEEIRGRYPQFFLGGIV